MHDVWNKQDTQLVRKIARFALLAKFANHPDFEDFLQEAVLKVYANRNKIPRGRSRNAYIKQIVLHCVFDVLRGYQKQNIGLHLPLQREFEDNDMELRVCEDLIVYPQEIPDPMLKQIVYKTVLSLSPPHRQVLLLKSQELEYNEIAAVLGVSVGTVRSRLHYARKLCAQQLHPHLS